jgi:hypothetical protein
LSQTTTYLSFVTKMKQLGFFIFLSLIGSNRPTLGAQHIFESANQCATCHPRQHGEWKGSMMHYAAQSPVFQAMDLTVRKLTGRFGPDDNDNPTFCVNCHSPVSAYNNELAGVTRGGTALPAMGEVGKEAITCSFCHSVQEPFVEKREGKGLLGDGISNAALIFYPTKKFVGPSFGATLKTNPYHGLLNDEVSSRYLKSSEFCGACHDVRVPNTPDAATHEPFQRLENLYSEWKNGPWNRNDNPVGHPVSCQGCHMSLYGSPDPSTQIPRPPDSESVRTHRFTAVSTTLIDEPDTFPHQNDTTVDTLNMPRGQRQRREQILKMACRLEWGDTPKILDGNVDTLPVRFTITNTGAGHRVPSGFSQERELWVALTVRTEEGEVIYQSGNLQDRAHPDFGENSPDGNRADEDLEDYRRTIDPHTFEVIREVPGPDINLRPFKNLGLVRFENAFLRKNERVHAFFLASQMDNTRSLPMLTPVPVAYDVPLGSLTQGPIPYRGKLVIDVKLKFRAFHPEVLRTLAKREPQLLDEKHIDRNDIVEMASLKKTIPVRGLRSVPTRAPDGLGYEFLRGNRRWTLFVRPLIYRHAVDECRVRKSELANADDYQSLFASPALTDNHDLKRKEFWVSAGPDAAQSESLVTKPFVCRPPSENER